MKTLIPVVLALLLVGCDEAASPVVVEDEAVPEPIEEPIDERCRDDPVGAWVVVDEEIYAVNAVAREFSDWPDGTAKHSLSMEDDGAEESEECVEAAVE